MTAVAQVRPSVRHVRDVELRRRRDKVVKRLVEHFGSLEDALAEEYRGSYPAAWLDDFTEYHAVTFLLGDDE